MTRRSVHVVIATSVLVAAPSAVRGQAPVSAQELADRIQLEFQPVWKKATDSPYISNCSFEQYEMTNNERLVQAITFKSRRGAEGRFAESFELTAFDQPGAKPFDSRVAAFNPRYEFKLHKPFGKSDWLLLAWRFAGENKPKYRPPVAYTPEIFTPFMHHLAFGGLPLDKLVMSPGWKVSSVQPSPGDEAMVRVAFTFSESTRPGFITQYSGWLDLDPAAGWCVRRSDSRRNSDALGKITSKHLICDNQYTVIDGCVPVVTHVQCKDADVKPDGSLSNLQRRVFRFDTKYPDSVSDLEFTMTAFGLPEPVGVSWEKPTPRYVWFLIATGVLGAMGIAFRILARRRADTKVPA